MTRIYESQKKETMKKTFIYALMACLAFAQVACSTDPEDATSKHIYGENENPYLKANADAVVATKAEFPVNRLEAKTIRLTDYAEIFHKCLGLTVDETLAALSEGKVVFYPINISRNVWSKVAPTKGANGWYYNTAGGVTDAESGVASAELNVAKKTIVLNVEPDAPVGTALSINVGFALNNGMNFDDYVRFAFDVTVTDPGRIVVANTIPAEDYAAFSIKFADYKEVIEQCMGMTLDEFQAACKDVDGPVALYMVNGTSKEWDTTSAYTAGGSGIGYWLTTDFKVTGWSGDGSTGSTLFVETQPDGDMVNIGRHPSATSGSVFNFSFVYALKADHNKFVEFIVKVTLE